MMGMLFISFLSVGLIFCTCICIRYSLFIAMFFVEKLRKNGNGYPPAVGTLIDEIRHYNRLYDYHTELSSKLKTYRILYPLFSNIYTSDPKNIEHILKSKFSTYPKGEESYQILKDFLGDGIFNVDGDPWRYQRKLASYEFSRRAVMDFSSSVFRSKAAELAQHLSVVASTHMAIDMQDLLMRTTLETMFIIGFGVEPSGLIGSTEKWQAFAGAFNDANAFVTKRYADVMWKLKRFLNIGSEAALKKHVKLIDDLVFKLILHKREHHGSPDGKECTEDDTLPDGFKVRKGDVVNYPIYAMGRMTYLWGNNADLFQPERWIEDGIFRPESPFKFTAFQAGPRICLGKEFAYQQMKIIAATLLYFYKFKLEDEQQEVRYRTMLTLHIDQGLSLHVFPRK